MQVPGRKTMTWPSPDGSAFPSYSATWSYEGRGTSLLGNNIGKSLLSILHLFSYLILRTLHEVGIISCLFYLRRKLRSLPTPFIWWPIELGFHLGPVCLTLESPASTTWFVLCLAFPEVQDCILTAGPVAQPFLPQGWELDWIGR